MCLIIAVAGLVLGFNFFMAQNYLLSSISVVISLGFIVLMLRNIKYVRELKRKKDDNWHTYPFGW